MEIKHVTDGTEGANGAYGLFFDASERRVVGAARIEALLELSPDEIANGAAGSQATRYAALGELYRSPESVEVPVPIAVTPESLEDIIRVVDGFSTGTLDALHDIARRSAAPPHPRGGE